MNLFLDVEGGRLADKIAPVLVVLPAPDELRIEVGVARVSNLLPRNLLGLEHRLVLGGRDVQPFVVGVAKRFNVFGGLRRLRRFRRLWGLGTLRHVNPPARLPAPTRRSYD